ncbi:hypothetical protein SAY87_016865 [Trapa incisa]|uniref:Uncharacterized protein n=1 Tax=Trapa incisa TaxID=236973 RepID=A0AAN7LA15_9MYRT|nr:hypothetical protein SAY87_016865 [Trapa incisa]
MEDFVLFRHPTVCPLSHPGALLQCPLPTAILPFEIHRSRFSSEISSSESGIPTALAGCAVLGGCPNDYIAIVMLGFPWLFQAPFSIDYALSGLRDFLKRREWVLDYRDWSSSEHQSLDISHNEANSAANPNEPLEKLLLNNRFHRSFMAFADSYLAGERGCISMRISMSLVKIPADDSFRRIYTARDIINKYILAGSGMEMNIYQRCRQEILTTPDIVHPPLFDIPAVDENGTCSALASALSICTTSDNSLGIVL